MNRPPAPAHQSAAPPPTNKGGRTVILLHRGGNRIRGTEAMVIRSVQALTDAGYRVIVCRNDACLDEPLNAIRPAPEIIDFKFPQLMIDGIRDISLPVPGYLKALRRLGALAKRSNARLLYASGGLPCQLGVPVARWLRIPLLCHLHHPAGRRYRLLWLTPFAAEWVFPSEFTRRHSLPNHPDRGRVLYNGVDMARFHPVPQRNSELRAALGIKPAAIVIGQVGALVPHKRPDFLLAAFRTLRQETSQPLHLCLVGTGPLEADMRKQVIDLGLEGAVSLTGYVEDVLPYYQHLIDINVMVSREEGLGISVIEGSACALPAVVCNCTGLSETILENRTGVSFELDDAEGLRQRLLRLVADPDLRTSLGHAGRIFAEERFSSTTYGQGLLAVVDDLIN